MWIVYWNEFHQRGFCCYILVVIDYDQITILDLEDLGTVRRKVTELCINSSIFYATGATTLPVRRFEENYLKSILVYFNKLVSQHWLALDFNVGKVNDWGFPLVLDNN